MRVIERTVYKFSELSDSAKEAARSQWREQDQHDDWWKHIYEDAVRMGVLLGIEICNKYPGKTRHPVPAIYFSGFHSQGDGACFEGTYNAKLDAAALISAEAPQDGELLAIARELTVLQTTARLKCGGQLEGRITSSSICCHSSRMDIGAVYVDGGDGYPTQQQQDDLTTLMRRFADWIYGNLEAEDGYLNSDECVDEALSQDHYEFDEDGAMI